MGYIILDDHNSALLKFNLNSHHIDKFSDIPMNKSLKGWYVNMDKVGNDGFLFENNLREIGYYHMKTNEKEILYENSRCPIYFDNKSILFNKKEKTNDGFQSYICLGDLDGGDCIKLKKIGLGDGDHCPVKINKDEAIIITSNNLKKKEVEIFNIKDLSFKSIIFADGIPKFSLNNGNLLCKDDNGGYFISNEFGEKKINVPLEFMNGYNMFPQAYFREINSILIYEFRERIIRNNVYNLWLLNIDTLDKKLLIKGAGTRKRGAIYIPD